MFATLSQLGQSAGVQSFASVLVFALPTVWRFLAIASTAERANPYRIL